MKRSAGAVLTITAALAIILVGLRVAGVRMRHVAGPSSLVRGVSPIVPAGVRIRVEVLNASTVRGLARRGTMYLRDKGFDVVENGGTVEMRDSTLILDRTGHPEWAALASKAMGGARIESRPDTLRDVDLTVLIGGTWRPPAEPFYP
jgi:hypothetical protein